MDGVIRGTVVYFFLWLILRIAGKRTLSEVTTFDFVLVLIISETTQQAMVRDDFSLINSFALIATLVGLDIGMSLLKRRWPRVDQIMEGVPLILIDEGEVRKDRLAKARVDEGDILTAARELRGLERLDQVKYAVLEPGGKISIVPKE